MRQRLSHLKLGVVILSALGVFQLTACSSQVKYEPRGGKKVYSTNGSIYNSMRNGNCGTLYVVRSGDTLSSIAKRCGVDLQEIIKLNHIVRPDRIYVNQELTLPQGASEFSNGVALPTQPSQTRPSQPLGNSTSKQKYQSVQSTPSKLEGDWRWPVASSADYKVVRDRNGVTSLEIYGEVGEPVLAAEAGEVVLANSNLAQLGQVVMIRHKGGFLSIYAHNDELLVKEGELVKRGQKIALLGRSGMIAQPKLLLEARAGGKKIDIDSFFKLRK